MKFSTKVIEKMVEILSEELIGYSEALGESGGVMAIEEEMRLVLREVGAQGLGQVLSKQDEGKAHNRVVACSCGLVSCLCLPGFHCTGGVSP